MATSLSFPRLSRTAHSYFSPASARPEKAIGRSQPPCQIAARGLSLRHEAPKLWGMHETHAALLKLLDAHWVVHVAWPDPAGKMPPHCTPLYYARLASRKECATVPPALIFFSDPASEHGQRQRDPIEVGASIGLETADISRIRGATLRGKVKRGDALPTASQARAQQDYLLRHPKAAPFLKSAKASLYLLTLSWAKLTDNQQTFGQHQQIEYGSTNAEPNVDK